MHRGTSTADVKNCENILDENNGRYFLKQGKVADWIITLFNGKAEGDLKLKKIYPQFYYDFKGCNLGEKMKSSNGESIKVTRKRLTLGDILELEKQQKQNENLIENDDENGNKHENDEYLN